MILARKTLCPRGGGERPTSRSSGTHGKRERTEVPSFKDAKSYFTRPLGASTLRACPPEEAGHPRGVPHPQPQPQPPAQGPVWDFQIKAQPRLRHGSSGRRQHVP